MHDMNLLPETHHASVINTAPHTHLLFLPLACDSTLPSLSCCHSHTLLMLSRACRLLNKVLGPLGTEYLHDHTILGEYGLTTILGTTAITATVLTVTAGAVTSTGMLIATSLRR